MITQCKICRKPFQGFGGNLCHDCLEEIEEAYKKVRDYIAENGGTSKNVKEIVEATEVPENIVMHLLDDGRLFVKSWTGDSLLCQMCRTPIESGKLCSACEKKVQGDFQKAAESSLKKNVYTGPRMHIKRGE